jgi:hypothetical protein
MKRKIPSLKCVLPVVVMSISLLMGATAKADMNGLISSNITNFGEVPDSISPNGNGYAFHGISISVRNYQNGSRTSKKSVSLLTNDFNSYRTKLKLVRAGIQSADESILPAGEPRAIVVDTERLPEWESSIPDETMIPALEFDVDVPDIPVPLSEISIGGGIIAKTGDFNFNAYNSPTGIESTSGDNLNCQPVPAPGAAILGLIGMAAIPSIKKREEESERKA